MSGAGPTSAGGSACQALQIRHFGRHECARVTVANIMNRLPSGADMTIDGASRAACIVQSADIDEGAARPDDLTDAIAGPLTGGAA